MFYLYLFVVVILLIALPIALGYHYQHHRDYFNYGSDYASYGFIIALGILFWPIALCVAMIALPFWILFKLPIWIDERKQAKSKSQ